MSVTLNVFQLRQALDLLTNNDSVITIKELQEGIFAWDPALPKASTKLEVFDTSERYKTVQLELDLSFDDEHFQ